MLDTMESSSSSSTYKAIIINLVLSILAGVETELMVGLLPWVNEDERPNSEVLIYCLGLFVMGLFLGLIRPRLSFVHPFGIFLGEGIFFSIGIDDSYLIPEYIFYFALYLPAAFLGIAVAWVARKVFRWTRKIKA